MPPSSLPLSPSPLLPSFPLPLLPSRCHHATTAPRLSCRHADDRRRSVRTPCLPGSPLTSRRGRGASSRRIRTRIRPSLIGHVVVPVVPIIVAVPRGGIPPGGSGHPQDPPRGRHPGTRRRLQGPRRNARCDTILRQSTASSSDGPGGCQSQRSGPANVVR